MTLFELVGGALGAMAAAGATYSAVTAKINSVVGKKEAPGDDSLRDLVMRIDGKIDAHHANTNDQFEALDRRLELVEQRVFTPPARAALFAAGSKKE